MRICGEGKNKFMSDLINKNETKQATDTSEELTSTTVIDYPLNKYEVKVRVDEDNKFVGIEEIKINKSFIENRHKTMQKGYYDVSKYYED